MKCQTILLKKFLGLKGAVCYEAIAMVIFSHVKISSFRVKVHLVFHWCLYNNRAYFWNIFPKSSPTNQFKIFP